MDRNLDPAKLVRTSSALASWISQEFLNSGLSGIALEIEKVTEEAVQRAEAIRRPNLALRVAIVSLLSLMIGVAGYHVCNATLKQILEFFDLAKGVAVYLFAILIFLITVEFKLKRRKALRAVHELRALAHIIDMHQLGKDHEIEKFRTDPNKFRDKIREYLHACTALLALVSKIGELYIEKFPDPVATAAVNEFEAVCNGLNSKIWQKIIAASLYRTNRTTNP